MGTKPSDKVRKLGANGVAAQLRLLAERLERDECYIETIGAGITTATARINAGPAIIGGDDMIISMEWAMPNAQKNYNNAAANSQYFPIDRALAGT